MTQEKKSTNIPKGVDFCKILILGVLLRKSHETHSRYRLILMCKCSLYKKEILHKRIFNQNIFCARDFFLTKF